MNRMSKKLLMNWSLNRTELGFPNGQGIFLAEAAQLTFYANTFDTDTATAGVQEAYTTATADITVGHTTITVENGSAFSSGNTIVVFDASGAVAFPWAGSTVTSSSATNVNLTPGSPAAFTALDGIVVNQYQTLVYDFDAVNGLLTLSTNGGAAMPVIPNVTALSFTYFDATNTQLIPATGTPLALTFAERAQIRKIVINLTLQDPLETAVTLNFNSDIDIRNNS